jgi:hypothetical protein
MLILFHLFSAPVLRFSELRRAVAGISRSAMDRVMVPISRVIGSLPSGVSSVRIVHFMTDSPGHLLATYTPAPTYVPLP